MKNPIDKLDDANIRSIDLYTGEIIAAYLAGDFTKREAKSELTQRLKEAKSMVNGITKLLEILKECPARIIEESE